MWRRCRGCGWNRFRHKAADSEAFLEFRVRDHVLTVGFIDRLKRHYAEFKATVPTGKSTLRRRSARPGGGRRPRR